MGISISFFFLWRKIWSVGVGILVGTDTGSLESLGGQLLVLVGDHVHAQRELIDVGLLASQVVDTDLRVRDTTVEPGLGVGLYSPSVSTCLSLYLLFKIIHPKYNDSHLGLFAFIVGYPSIWRPWGCARSPPTQQPRSISSEKEQAKCQTDLVLAVAVAPRGTTSHLD